MRSSILIAAPFVAAAYAQSSDAVNTTVVPVSSGSTTVESTFSYSNGLTSFLTQTNSNGVITGMPAVETAQSALPPAVTAQPSVATIPAGLPEGVTHILINISRSLTSFEVSVGSSTTVVVDEPSGATIVSGATATGTETDSSSGSSSTGSSSDSNNDDDSSSSDASGTSDSESSASSTGDAADSTSSDSSAPGHLKMASAGMLGFGALVAAFL
ncbi:hypothetical protein Q7P37_001468 [Cladosporium fusiforme]